MNLDIRLPIGLLFVILGGLLVAYGLITMSNAVMYERSLTYNVNLWWGVSMLVFGAIMTFFGARRGPADASTSPSGEPPAPRPAVGH